VLLVGESSGFASTEHVLTRSYVSPAIFMWFVTPCVPVRMFGVPTWFLGSS